ncbi:MAG: hypothetical protein LBU04_07130 [Christensenellaceae bacterium]|jgi:NDP-sugar pyrophosphorylase family protein|nr:hypothetical protein [Christensenellaceae bacterium]
MKNKKYELTDKTMEYDGVTLHRIRALRNIWTSRWQNVKVGDLGGWIENEGNLSHKNWCWIFDEAKVFDEARVSGNATVSGKATVGGDARVCGNARVFGNAKISGNASVFGSASVFDNAMIWGNAMVYDNASVSVHEMIFEDFE